MKRDVFEAIYRSNGWQGSESLSGPGSGFVPTEPIVRALELVIWVTGAQSVLNIGCGDDVWSPELPGYLGIDVAPTAIARAQAAHPERSYRVHDARKLDGMPSADLAICRDVLQHCSYRDARAIVAIARSRSRWQLFSTYLHRAGESNHNIRTGDYYSPDLTAAPFTLAQPELLIFDGWDYGKPGRVRDPSKYLGLWRSH